MGTMNVMYCGDGFVERGVLLSVLSLASHTDDALAVYLVTARVGGKDPIGADFARFLDGLLRTQHRPESSAALIDATQAFLSEPPSANMGTRFTPCCMLRLYADELPGLPDRILYLDSDVVCLGNPAELYATDLGGAEFAGALDYYGRFFFRRNVLHMDYVNSGVLLMDLARMRRTGLLAACRRRCATKRMFMPDQSALNKLAASKRVLPGRMNDQRRTHDDTVMRHYSNCFGFFPPRLIDVKPWQIERMHDELHDHSLDALYARYEGALCRLEALRSEACAPEVAAAAGVPAAAPAPTFAAAAQPTFAHTPSAKEVA